jgi:tRNA pseudouridine55 synthase
MDGILLVDKPAGLTSFRVVSKIKRHFNLKKVGHGGTLDPFATGLLVILIGKATKVSATFLEHDKAYEGLMALGKETDTYDVDGKVTHTSKVILSESEGSPINDKAIKRIFTSFEGQIEQVPPPFSAIKVGGKRAYQLARQGKEVKLAKRLVNIYFLRLDKFEKNCVYFTTKVSKGTYIRSLARDVGQKLKTGAYLHELRRTSSGDFLLKNAYELEEVLKWNKEQLGTVLTK